MIAFAACPSHAFSQDNVKPPKDDASHAELEKWIVHALGKQSHTGDTGMFEVVRGMLPGLGTIVPVEVMAGSEAAGKTLGQLNLRGRTGATVVALSRGDQRDPAPPATTRVEAGDLLALTGSGTAIGLAAALLLARDTSLPPSGTAASAPPGA